MPYSRSVKVGILKKVLPPESRNSADDFFDVISKRYEKGSIIITTNKTFE